MLPILSIEFLLHLARHRPDIQNLKQAMRLAVMLQSIEQTFAKDRFSYTSWQQSFFKEDAVFLKKDPNAERIQQYIQEYPHCILATPARIWLEGYDLPGFIEDAAVAWGCSVETIETLLAQPLFAAGRKSLQNYFKRLQEDGFIIADGEDPEKGYRLIENLVQKIERLSNPRSNPIKGAFLQGLTQRECSILADGIAMLSFLDPRFDPIANHISSSSVDYSRIFLHLDYILPEDTQIRVDDLQDRLQLIWESQEASPVSFIYSSASLENQDKECIVYPICIYYVQRAKYLCAYGQAPSGAIQFYNYRLDRVIAQTWRQLDWTDARVPKQLYTQWQSAKLPTPDLIQQELRNAWGFDFYQPAFTAILRFERRFHERYIKDTFRHETFKRIDSAQASQLIQQEADASEKMTLLNILAQRSPEDAYYSVRCREGDNNLIMRLRSWSPNAEVIAPYRLRQRMVMDTQASWSLYCDKTPKD